MEFYKLADLKENVKNYKDKFIVCDPYINKKGLQTYKYYVFDGIYDYYIHTLYKKGESIHYNELIFGDREQKLYFDIDIKIENKSFNEEIIDARDFIFDLKDAITSTVIGSSKDDIYVFSSHRENKISYHVILNKFKFKSSAVLKYLANTIKEKIDEKDQHLIDILYKDVQQLRLLGSSKLNTNNLKIYDQKDCNVNLNPKDDKERYNLFLISVVGYVKDCELYNIDIVDNSNKNKDYNDMDEGDMKNIYKYMEKYQHYTITNDIGDNGILHLKRLQSAYCGICDRIHDAEGGYIYKSDGKYILKCFRNNDKSGIIIGEYDNTDELLSNLNNKINLSPDILTILENENKSDDRNCNKNGDKCEMDELVNVENNGRNCIIGEHKNDFNKINKLYLANYNKLAIKKPNRIRVKRGFKIC